MVAVEIKIRKEDAQHAEVEKILGTDGKNSLTPVVRFHNHGVVISARGHTTG